jgi:nicotinamidase-related amidase
MQRVLDTARKAKLRVFYAMHHRYRPGDYESWTYIAPIQRAAWRSKSFEYGSWGGEFRAEFVPQPGEIVASEHWCSSGFANTDLDLQLKKHGIRHNVEIIGGSLMVQHYVETLGLNDHLILDSEA